MAPCAATVSYIRCFLKTGTSGTTQSGTISSNDGSGALFAPRSPTFCPSCGSLTDTMGCSKAMLLGSPDGPAPWNKRGGRAQDHTLQYRNGSGGQYHFLAGRRVAGNATIFGRCCFVPCVQGVSMAGSTSEGRSRHRMPMLIGTVADQLAERCRDMYSWEAKPWCSFKYFSGRNTIEGNIVENIQIR